MVARVLVVAADPATLDLAAAGLDNDGHVVLRADCGSAIHRNIRGEGDDILVTDDMFPRIARGCSSAIGGITPASRCRSS